LVGKHLRHALTRDGAVVLQRTHNERNALLVQLISRQQLLLTNSSADSNFC